MMIYEVASVEDHGVYWEVTNVMKKGFTTADEEQSYLKLSHVSYKKIQKAIMEGQRVKIKKPLQSNEVMPNELEIINEDDGSIDHYRKSEIRRAGMIITPSIGSLSGLSMYGFICLNNELAEKGFFITDDNRESMYLKILETGDEKLISKLEDYLNYKDEIARIAGLHNKYEALRDQIADMDSTEEITKATDEFLEDYYSRY